MKIVWSAPARQDLRDIFEYISETNINAASKLLTEINERVLVLTGNPAIGRPGRVNGAKELVLRKTHYILPYRVHNNQVQILAIFHTARQWPKQFDE